MKNNFLLLLFLFFGASIFAQKTEYLTKLNIPYYNDSIAKTDQYISERCVLDIYYPKNVQGFKCLNT